MANVYDVAKFFIDLAQKQASTGDGDLVTNLRLQKLLYFAQGWFLARYGKPLFDAPIEAWTYGPVVPEVYHEYKIYSSNGISQDANVSADAFSADEFNLLLDVAREYDSYSTSALVNLTHEHGTPWEQTAQSEIISNENLRQYFSSLKPLSSFESQMSKLEVFVPRRDEYGNAVFDEDWGDDDAY